MIRQDGTLVLYGRNEQRAFDLFFAAALTALLQKREGRAEGAADAILASQAFDVAQEAVLARRQWMTVEYG